VTRCQSRLSFRPVGPGAAMPKAPRRDAERDIRCDCGKLVARWEDDGIAIKCGRCGRVVTIPYSAIQGRPPTG
jgi:hypothetical protein